MKLLLCQRCMDMIAPYQEAMRPRECFCGDHSVWWVLPEAGILQVYDRLGVNQNALVIGMHNMFIFRSLNSKEDYKRIIDETPSDYIFKTMESVVIKFRPGESRDTSWAKELPKKK